MWIAVNSFHYNGGVEGREPYELIHQEDSLEELMEILINEGLTFSVEVIKVEKSTPVIIAPKEPSEADISEIEKHWQMVENNGNVWFLRDLKLYKDGVTDEWVIINDFAELCRVKYLPWLLFKTRTLN